MLLTLMRNEWRQLWRSFQLPALALVLLFFALSDPLLTRYQNEIVQMFVADQKVEISLPTPTAAQALGQFFGDVSQLGLFVLILIGMGIVAAEKENGLTGWMLTRPVTRQAYLGAKVATLMLAVVALLIAGTAIAWAYTGSLLGPVPAGPLVWTLAGVIAYAVLIVAFLVLASTVARSPWSAGGLTILVLFANSLIYALAQQSTVGRFVPYRLIASIGQVLTAADSGNAGLAGLWDLTGPALVTSMLLAALLLVLAFASFARQEIPNG
ncbi:MAG: ABC transporter permease subunit [Limnochordales bacterium]|nr:ABC transporter permease subunit [Limnochordales bacterium]